MKVGFTMDFMLEYEIDYKQESNLFESMKDIFYINILSNIDNSNYISEQVDYYIESVSDVIEKILKKLEEFFHKMLVSIEIKKQQATINKKLDELKDIMAKKKAKALGSKVDYFDIKKYKSYYTEFINAYTKELINGFDKDFKTVKEYEAWRVEMLNKLSDFNYKLSDTEQWKLSVSINDLIELSEKQSKNREKDIKMVQEQGSKAIKNLENYYKKIDTENSYVNYENEKLKIVSLHNTFIGQVCAKLAQCVKTIATIISKVPIRFILLAITFAIAL